MNRFCLLMIAALSVLTPRLALAACGDGVIDGTDVCDDGNTRTGDGCSSTCTVEAGFACVNRAPLAVTNASFEAGTASMATGWEVIAGNIDRVDGTAFSNCWPAGDGTFSIDLNGSNAQGVIAQSFTTAVGATYGLTFLGNANCAAPGDGCGEMCMRTVTVGVANNTAAPDGLDVQTPFKTIDYVLLGSSGAPTSQPWQVVRFEFTAVSTSTILFFSGSAPSFDGPMIDDVRMPQSSCRVDTCGNGSIQAGEACDDGNVFDGDGCSGDCSRVETGYTCAVPGTPCVPNCGDGLKVNLEACDDGNNNPGDGCSPICLVEPGFGCVVIPPDTTSFCCMAGFLPGPSDGGIGCVDVDECAIANGGCDPNATCMNTPGGRTCTCNPPFVGNGIVCAPIMDMSAVADMSIELPDLSIPVTDMAVPPMPDLSANDVVSRSYYGGGFNCSWAPDSPRASLLTLLGAALLALALFLRNRAR
jgi:cysteine-rich repeat protein